MMFISIIPPDKIINHVPKIKALLEEVIDLLAPRALPSDLIAAGISGEMVFWGVFDEEAIEAGEEPLVAILVTMIRPYPRCKVLELIALSGDHGQMKHYIEKLNLVTHAYALVNDCAIREIPGGRTPWARYLVKFGFKPSKLVALECPVEQEGRQ